MSRHNAHLVTTAGVRVPLYVQDEDITDRTLLHLSNRMSASQWTSPDTTAADLDGLFDRHHCPSLKTPRPLFHVDPKALTAVQLELHDGKTLHGLPAAPLFPVPGIHGHDVTLTNVDVSSPVHYFLHCKTDPDTGRMAVWRVDASLYPASETMNSDHQIVVGAARVRHLIRSMIGERVDRGDHPAAIGHCLSNYPHVMEAHPAEDSIYMNALSVGFAIESDGRSLLHTHLGHQLLHSTSSPSEVVQLSPDTWAREVAKRALVSTCVSSTASKCRCADKHVDAYLDAAHEFDRQLTEGMLSDWYSRLTRGASDGISKMVPGDDLMKKFNNMAVTTAGSAMRLGEGALKPGEYVGRGAKALAFTETAKAAVLAALGTQQDAHLSSMFAKKMLEFVGMDKAPVDDTLIEGAPNAVDWIKDVVSNVSKLNGKGELTEYVTATRNKLGSPSPAAIAIFQRMREAPVLWEKYGKQEVATGSKFGGAGLTLVSDLVKAK